MEDTAESSACPSGADPRQGIGLLGATGSAGAVARAQVLQRGLPRPAALGLVLPLQPEGDLAALPAAEAAERLLRSELAALLKHDNAAYPIGVRLKNLFSLKLSLFLSNYQPNPLKLGISATFSGFR